jgi:hypothetical protein
MAGINTYSFFLIYLLFFLIGCNNNVNKPIDQPDIKYKVDGIVYYENMPLANVIVLLDTNTCNTDSLGYFSFENVESKTARLNINHPLYKSIDTTIIINKNYSFRFDMFYRSNSFFPLAIGNKWFYAESRNTRDKHSIEVLEEELIGGKYYFKLLNKFYRTDLMDTSKYFTYMSIENDSLFELNCDQTGLLAPFNTAIYDTFIYNNGCNVSYYGIPFEKDGDVLKIYYTPSVLVFDAWTYRYFQKGIGIIKRETAWAKFYLEKFEIK